MLFINLVLTFPKQGGGGGAAVQPPHPHRELLVAHIHTGKSLVLGGEVGGWPLARLRPLVSTPLSVRS